MRCRCASACSGLKVGSEESTSSPGCNRGSDHASPGGSLARAAWGESHQLGGAVVVTARRAGPAFGALYPACYVLATEGDDPLANVNRT